MTVEATPKNVEWLFEKLYEVYRTLASRDRPVTNPVFTFLVKKSDVDQVAKIITLYLHQKYGALSTTGGKIEDMCFSHDGDFWVRIMAPYFSASILIVQYE